MDLPTFAVLAGITAAAGLAKGLTGFGAAMIMAPLFGLIVAPAQSAAMIVLLHGLTAWQGLGKSWRTVDWRRVAALAAIALLCHQLALHAVNRVEPALLRRWIGAAVLAMGLLALLGIELRHRGGRFATVLAGMVSGVFTALGGLGGPPVVYYFNGQGGPHTAVRANLLAYFMVLFIGASIGLLLQGQLGMTTVRDSVLLLPFFCVGALAGEALFARLPSSVFARVVQLALIAIGGATLLI